MFKKLIIYFIIIILTAISYGKTSEPKDPDDPSKTFTFEGENNDNSSDNQDNYNIKYLNNSGILKKGIIKNFTNFYLSLKWDENQSGLQEILIDFVESIRIIGYKMEKKGTKNNFSRIYYYPYVFNIKMKNGDLIKNAKGRIQKLDSFTIYNSLGKEKCYTYFVRYWLEDKKRFYDNNSNDYNEMPILPKSLIIYLEFVDNTKVNY